MKSAVISPDTQTLDEVYIADLRFIADHQLINAGKAQIDTDDQEDYMGWLALMNDSVVVDGFIAPEQGANTDEDELSGTLYGDEQLHDSLRFLREKADKAMGAFRRRQALEAANSDKTSSGEKDKKQNSTEATVVFTSP